MKVQVEADRNIKELYDRQNLKLKEFCAYNRAKAFDGAQKLVENL